MTTAGRPAWLAAARTKLGTREAAGPANSPTILAWAKRLGARVLGMAYNADSVPWCGLFVATCMAEAGIAAPPIPLRAKSWATWGLGMRPDRVAPGAVLVFQRPGGGHVGFYVGGNDRSYLVLGGNQGDCVSETWIAKDRCIAIRWPAGQPVNGSSVQVAARAGDTLSANEA